MAQYGAAGFAELVFAQGELISQMLRESRVCVGFVQRLGLQEDY